MSSSTRWSGLLSMLFFVYGCGGSPSTATITPSRVEQSQQTCKRDEIASVGLLHSGKTQVVLGQNIGQKEDTFEIADDFSNKTGIPVSGGMSYLEIFRSVDEIQKQLNTLKTKILARQGWNHDLAISFGAASTPAAPQGSLIALGIYDEQIRALADFLNSLEGRLVYLRIGYEFDLLGGQYGPPDIYKSAYRRVADGLCQQNVNNVSLVWHSSGAFFRADQSSGFFGLLGGLDPTGVALTIGETLTNSGAPNIGLPISDFYPGREYVDFFAISYWGDSCCFGPTSNENVALYEKETRRLLNEALALGLPLRMGEATPGNVGANSGDASVDWVNRYLKLIEEYNIQSTNLISIDWSASPFFSAFNGFYGDARLQDYDDTRRAISQGLSQERYR
ncbi:MAG: hypothetical protein U1D69_10920 [Polynucleobacter sp.]|nr:hypothetical protein [Polynucleobacter sp.]